MASMSYCRFENTVEDLRRCVSDLQNNRRLSESENEYRHRLYELAQEYIEAYDCYEPETKYDEDEDY